MAKVNICVFTHRYVNELLSDLRKGISLSKYYEETFEFERKFPPGETLIFLDESFSLKNPENPRLAHLDVENSIALYEELKNLDPMQASDRRLWTYLAHVTFWDYMKKRWPLELADEENEADTHSLKQKQIRFIETHWFLKTSNDRWLRRNGISRLWWFAHLTYDPAGTDPYELTKVLLSKQDIAQSILERSLGRNKKILNAMLLYIKDNPTATREQVREITKLLNLEGGVKLLTALEQNELVDLVYSISNSL